MLVDILSSSNNHKHLPECQSVNELRRLILLEDPTIVYLNEACDVIARHRRHRLEGYSLQVRYKQDCGQGFILLLPQAAALPESDADSDVVKPASGFVIQNRQTTCSMWCPMYRARC